MLIRQCPAGGQGIDDILVDSDVGMYSVFDKVVCCYLKQVLSGIPINGGKVLIRCLLLVRFVVGFLIVFLLLWFSLPSFCAIFEVLHETTIVWKTSYSLFLGFSVRHCHAGSDLHDDDPIR